MLGKQRWVMRRNGIKMVRHTHTGILFVYDVLLLMLVSFFILVVFPSSVTPPGAKVILTQVVLSMASIFGCRFACRIYKCVWRYGSSTLYLKLMLVDAMAGFIYVAAQYIPGVAAITFIRAATVVSLNLLATLFIRLVYQFLYEHRGQNMKFGQSLRKGLYVFAGISPKTTPESSDDSAAQRKIINIAIVGAGRVGVSLASELMGNSQSPYKPCCFIDIDNEKIGRFIYGLPVWCEGEGDQEIIEEYRIQEIVLAVPNMQQDRKRELYERYRKCGCRIRVYDAPEPQSFEPGKRHQLRAFDIEDLLFRRPIHIVDADTRDYYTGKKVLISGGGGSIGSELCRQIAKMKPAKLILVDIYENGAYDILQELKLVHGKELEITVEISSVCDRDALERIFEMHRPDIVLHAAAHKHVPLMEHNCCEAVYNNVFGTLNIVEVAEKYEVEKFTMISTDKAVNPTNVMGATKRMCELIVLNRKKGKTNFSATRFGNVLGSNGSVIPLFRRQIAAGGPVTITDKRIIRYFMTIPEAVQLVLQSSAMAKNGELFALDMGKPVKILELAENMIRLSGLEPYKDIEIVETGLRPGEKLYEELLIRTEELDRTMNDMLFVERERPRSMEQIQEKLDVLREALSSGNDDTVRAALKRVVKTYRNPVDVNIHAADAEEMKCTVG